jgi:uncharacterized membrane protein
MKPCFGLLMLLFVACNNPSPVPVPQNDSSSQTNDTPLAVPEVSSNETDSPTSFVPGYYTGLLPCADCMNISRRVLFLQDHSFHLMDTYNGKQVAPIEAGGQWQTTNDQLQLLVNNTVIKRFMVTNKGLKEVSVSGTPVAVHADVYLTRKMIGGDNAAWMEKKAAGIDFFALGTEPFWLMEMDADKQISFLQVENNQTTVFPYVAPVPQNGQLLYSVQNDSTKLQIVITPQFCSDGMSDNWYEYKVEANFNGSVYNGCGVRLNERWTIGNRQ